MSDESSTSVKASPAKLGWLKVLLIGMSGYLLGSFIPAGYIRYAVLSQFFPERLAARSEKFDRTKLNGAVRVGPLDLTDALDTNPSLFRQRYLDKPVTLTGDIQYFLDGSLGSDALTLTLRTKDEYGASSVILTFDDPKASGLAELKKGGPVTATCMTTGMTTESVHLGHCELAK